MALNIDETIQQPQEIQTISRPVLSSSTAREITITNLKKLREIEETLQTTLNNNLV